ncbi:MAG: SGNH/GDSL hydrolase family protein [Verrucomicrobia bacterium]|nr:SGNH/GDSL hydrolase family protein [Verrucomicrobiota bacterium]
MNRRLKSLLLLALIAANCLAAEPAKKAAKKAAAKAPPNPALAPIQDVAGLPRVLLVGDTVSIAYTLPTRKLLEGKANVHRIPQNGAYSQIGAEQITEWVGAGPWDLIHFNFGAYDLMLGKDGKVVVPPEIYESNLRLIVAKLRLQAPTARLVFATTTPMPAEPKPGALQYDLKNADAYAAIAAKVMKETGVRVNDLRAAIQPRAAELQVPGTISFKPAGFELMAQQVAREIESALKEPAPVPEKTASTQKGLRVFTCGHSFHVWIVPLLSEMALGAGIADHRIAGKSSIGGSTVLRHWDVADDKNIAKRVLSEGKADVLTLSPIWLPDAGIENFAKLAVEHNPNIRITVQEYWLPNDEYHPVYPLETRKKVDHNATTIPALQKAQDDYDRDIDEHVRAINTKLGTKALVTVPVGQAVVKLREKIIAGECPGIKEQSELFRDTWGHPTQPIQALAGYCHFAVIYQRSPVGLPRPAILSRNPAWDDKLNRLLQELAWDAVTKHPMSGVRAK